MMMLQKYQFELRNCSHIFLCHKEAEISLAKKVQKLQIHSSNGQLITPLTRC
jgi:hypothetical protein